MPCGDKFMEWEVNIKFLMKLEKTFTGVECYRQFTKHEPLVFLSFTGTCLNVHFLLHVEL